MGIAVKDAVQSKSAVTNMRKDLTTLIAELNTHVFDILLFYSKSNLLTIHL